MSHGNATGDSTVVEPSWLSALSEADTASRRLAQGARSLERLSRELAALQQWGDTTARLEVAHALTDGPDGGALSMLVTSASEQAPDPGLRRVASALLDRLTSSLGLQPIVERGEHLWLLPEELGEFDIRGRLESPPAKGTRGLFRVLRTGWWLGNHIVQRPLLEPVAEDTSRPAAPPAAPGAWIRRPT